MTAVERYDPAPIAPTDPTGGRLVAWAQAATAANQLAKALSRTNFVPTAFQGKEYDATAAIIMGDELGLSPLAALRSIYVIHGQPAMYARTMVALAQSQGHEIWTDEATDAKVTVSGQRRGSTRVETRTWTAARATKAGYTSNKKYTTNPQEMLYAKAAAEVARAIAADVLAGVPYTVEDLELEQAPTVTVTRNGNSKTTPIRRQAPAAPPEPGFDDITPDPITDPQLTKLNATFTDAGITGDARFIYAEQIINRPISSTKDLTKHEASQVIDHLDKHGANLEGTP